MINPSKAKPGFTGHRYAHLAKTSPLCVRLAIDGNTESYTGDTPRRKL